MGDGASPSDLVKKRNLAEIKRLEWMIESQELEVMELEEKIVRLKENIKASKDQIKKQEQNIVALKEEVDG